MPATTSFNAETILLKDSFSMIQLEVFILTKLNINVILYGSENWNSEANMVLLWAVHRYIRLQMLLNNLL